MVSLCDGVDAKLKMCFGGEIFRSTLFFKFISYLRPTTCHIHLYVLYRPQHIACNMVLGFRERVLKSICRVLLLALPFTI